ncbi:subtilisin BPN [Colletotrichum higginsianum]|uniref:Subtilisin BPN n=1 Tax=Colletotrichum higginsianum (strain IMI 349063) TaxID=759273 RepID=H1VFT0_COLHI|nr:subtilisin BPN [Colletotrichum higginsianum]
MRFASVVVSVLALAGTGAAKVSRRAVSNEEDVRPSNDTVVAPKKFIIELDQAADKDAVVRQLQARPGSRVLKVFDSAVFRGVAVESDSENTDSLEALAPVVKAWHSTRVQLAPVVAGESFSDDARAPDYAIHWMTGVDKLHEQGILGKGVKVGVVDTGVEYTHPALGGCFGAGCKIAGGYDFVGDNTYWPYPGEERQPDEDPMDSVGHGTHVTGIIAGKSAEREATVRIQPPARDPYAATLKIFADTSVPLPHLPAEPDTRGEAFHFVVLWDPVIEKRVGDAILGIVHYPGVAEGAKGAFCGSALLERFEVRMKADICVSQLLNV